MTFSQEDALYEFLDNTIDPFDLEMVLAFIRMIDPKRVIRLADEIKELINFRNLAFPIGNRQWISRRGCFEPMPFVICPSSLELLNGILIPGHRCVPFANPNLLPQEYVFQFKGSVIPFTSTEGAPEEFYPYYSIFGEEYAPQYVAQDNPENEAAFNSDPYEDPPEVAISTLDMRNIYRETAFVPGDRFIVQTLNWKNGIFSLERVGGKEWEPKDLYPWLEAAEAGFEDSFSLLGPASSTEEQIAYAYWYGGKRMWEVPAYSMEEFLFEKTERVEIVPYGIETRFWYMGRDIPDFRKLSIVQISAAKDEIESLLNEKNICVSRNLVRAYIRDFLFRGEIDTAPLIDRIVPPVIVLNPKERKYLEEYITTVLEEIQENYTPYTDKIMGPIRQRVGELHTAVIDLAIRLERENIDPSWLPKHVFIILSQIQSHAAGIMEDLDTEENPLELELDAIDNSLDNMIETYEDIKGLIETALNNYKRNRFSLVRNNRGETGEWLVQLGIGGIDVWRRLIISEEYNLEDLHRIIQSIFGWKNTQVFQFSGEEVLDNRITIGDLGNRGIIELLYEYGTKWTVKIMLLTRSETREEKPVRCVAGAGAAPPENIGGPLRFKRFVSALNGSNDAERRGAEWELGKGFNPGTFDMDLCNRNLHFGISPKGRH